MDDKHEVEKSLKRFLKKKVAYTDGLLVAFLITGVAGYASSVELASQAEMTKEELLANIAAQKAEIEAMIDANNERLKELDMDTDELIRKGDFYAKPIYGSTQIFFSYGYDHEGRAKDKTNKEWKTTKNAIAYKLAGYENPKGINPYAAGEQKNGIMASTEDVEERLLDPDANGNIPEGLSAGDAAQLSGADIGKLLVDTNGVYVHQTPWVEEIDLGANILPLSPTLPTVGVNVNANVVSPDLGDIPNPTISVPSAPSAPTVTAPSLSAPAAVTPLTITAPTAPTPSVPTEKTISIAAPTLPGGYEPTAIKIPTNPTAPTNPSITLFSPFDITFNGTGYPQPDTPAIPMTNRVIENMTSYDSGAAGTTITTGAGGTSWTGTVVSSGGNLNAGATATLLNSYINHAADLSVVVKGSYDFISNAGGNNTKIFVSLNPYDTGEVTADDKVFDFQGTLTIHGNGAGGTEANVGFEHQLLADGDVGGENFANTNKPNGTTSILKNTGTINLQDGTNMVGFMIDTEYFNGQISGVGNSAFVKLPQTINEGVINIGSGATKSVGIDYGYFYTGVNGEGPNSTVTIGTINVDGTNNYGVRLKDYSTLPCPSYGRVSPLYYDYVRLEGVANKYITVKGQYNIGISISQGRSSGDPTGGFGHLDDTGTLDNADLVSGLNIIVGGSENVGFYRNPNYAGANSTAMTLNSTKIGDVKFDTAIAGTHTSKSTLFRTDLNEIILDNTINLDLTTVNTDNGDVENSFMQAGGTGTVTNKGTLKSSLPKFYGLTAGDFTASTGATAKNDGILTLTGKNSIGIAIAATNTGNNSGTINATGAGSTGIYNLGTANVTGGSITATGAGSAGIYNNGGITNISGTVGITAGDGATGLISDGGSLTSASTNNLTIGVTGSSTGDGVGVFGLGGTTMDINGAQITVANGSAGVASIGTGTSIDLQGGLIDFEGQGFAAYTDGVGTIDLTHNGKIYLRGKSVGYTLDMTGGVPVAYVTFDPTSTITMYSNDAVAMNLKLNPLTTYDLGNATQVGSLIQMISTSSGGVTVLPGTIGPDTFDKYRLAATEEGKIRIDSVLDKSQDGSLGQYDPSFFFFRSFLAQKSQLYVEADINANLTSSIATDFYKGYVTGLEMNSSSTATGVSDSLLQVGNHGAGKDITITADRTDAGAGAIGVYSNYGIVNVDTGSKINVETGANTINDNGIGIYGVDGSQLTNAGDVTVAGNKGIGMLGLAYRNDSTGTAIIKEYGALPGEGITTITNNGNITVKGNESVGMYMVNNSPDAPDPDHTTLTMINTSNIEVGTDAGAQKAVGMYGDGDVNMQFTAGNIAVGENGIGMYGARGANISAVAGTFTLGKDGIGVISDGTTTITATGTATFTGAYITGESGKIGVAYVGPTAGTIETTPQTLGMNIDVSGLDHGSALYVRDKSALTTTGTLTVGNEGVGVYLANGDATNTGAITLVAAGNKAVGMYTTNGTVINNGTVTENNNTQFGLVGNGAAATVDNALGTVQLAAGTGSTGILVANGATLANQGTINFTGATSSFGIVATGAIVNLTGTPVYTMNNADKNIFVYGEKGSTVNLAGNVTFNGGGPAGNDKSVGVYLDGTAGANTLNAGTLQAQGGLIGVYSKGNNTLTSGTYNVSGDGTVGVYLENDTTMDGVTLNVDAPTNAVGVYGAGGSVVVGPTGVALNLGPTSGTGMYFEGGAAATGGKITVNNTSASPLPAMYYTGTTPATHSADIDIIAGSNGAVGIFTDGGADVTNTAVITDYAGSSVGAVVGTVTGTASTFTNAGNITQGTAGTGAIGIYTVNGTAKNTVNINMIDGIGVTLDGTLSKFDGTGGNINITGTGTGIALTGTGAGQVISAGTVNLATGSLGVYAENSSIMDFPVILTGTGATGVYAKGGTTISGTIDAGGSTDTIGLYTEDATVIMNGATVKAGSQGAAAAIGVYFGGTGQNYSYTGNTIEAVNSGSVGIYVANGNTYNFGDIINVGPGAIGIMTSGAGSTLETNNGTINITGAGIGVVANGGSVANVGVSGPINVSFNGAGGILSFTDGGTVNLGSNINIIGGAGTLAATKDGNLTNSGTITVAEGSIGLLGLYDTGSGTLLNDSTGNITVKAGGIGMAAKAVSPTSTGSPTVQNDNIITADGASAVGMYANIGTVNNVGTVNATNGGIGIYTTNTDGPGASVTSLGTLNVTSGTGYVIDGGVGSPAPTAVAIILNAGTDTDRSIGGYYKDVNGNIDQPTGITVNGDYTIAMAIDGGTNTISNVNDIASAKNNIGVSIKGSTTTVGNVSVTGPENNIGVYGNAATLTVNNITVGPSTATSDKSKSSIGVYMNSGNVASQGTMVGNDSIGLFGKNANISVVGDIVTGNNALGAYVDGDGTNTLSVLGNITAGEHSLGTYGKNANVTVQGDMSVAANLGIGIVSEGTGDVNYQGTATVADKGADSASIGIYKGAGAGNIIANGTFNIGKGGYAIYADNLTGAAGNIAVQNNATIYLAESGVGIYAGGQATADNAGSITVGPSFLANADHSVSNDDLNSIGMYGEGGAQLSNSGNINVSYDHSVGAYVKDVGTLFTNNAGATITVDNGGVGILAVQNAKIINNGDIIINETTAPDCGGHSVGIGLYSNSAFDNNGTVTVNGGYGVYLADATNYTNYGTMNITNGAGITGKGTYVNNGTVNVSGSGSEIATVAGEEDPVRSGAITIANNGSVVIGNQYIGKGTLVALGQDINLAGAMVDLTTGKTAFVGDTVNGTIKLTNDFINTGNGYSWTAQDFIQTATNIGLAGKISITTSPLYMAHMTGNDLAVVKQPYAYLATGSQFDNLYNGVDSLLALDQEGTSQDSQVLKGLNSYLDNVYNTQGQQAFDNEASRTLSEMRGDIYATIKGRMNRVENAFDNSFDELMDSYNFSRNTGKFSVVYNNGKYKDKTLGIDDYKYGTTGLLYMHEYEGRNYASKFGYTLGFGVSRFDFDDSPTFNDKSKEDVYSLRAGIHNVHSFGEDDKTRLVTKLGVGYNRHEAERTIELDQKYKNKAGYNTWAVSLDNKLEKTLYRSVSAGVELYGGVNLEYAKVDDFSEKSKGNSALKLKVKDKDYLSVEGAVGVKGHKRVYIGKKISAKITGDVAYVHEFGDNYGRTKAKVAGGTEGYYSLIKPDEESGKVRGRVGVTLEKADHYGVSFDVEVRKGNNKKGADVRYGVRFTYKFGGGK